MLLTESGSNSTTYGCFSEQRSPGYTLNRRGQRQFGPFRALCGHDAHPLAVRQPLQVVAGRHHRHHKVGARLANGADQLAAHLLNGRKCVFNLRARLRDSAVSPLLGIRQRLVPMAFALNPVPVAVRFQPGFALLGRIAPIGIDIPAGVGRVHDRLEVLAVVCAGGVGHDLADELVPLVDIHRELVAMVAHAMFLGPGRIQVLLAPLGRLPVGGHGVFFDLFLLIPGEVLPGCRHQRGIDDLPSTRDEALPEQLHGDALEDSPGAGFADPVLEHPDCRPVGNVGGQSQTAEALVAHPVQQLVFHLFVGQVVEALENQNAYHRFSGKRRSATLWATRAWGNSVDFRRQGDKVDAGFDLGEWIAQLVEGPLVLLVGKQVSLDGAASFHRGPVPHGQMVRILPHVEQVFRGARKCARARWTCNTCSCLMPRVKRSSSS